MSKKETEGEIQSKKNNLKLACPKCSSVPFIFIAELDPLKIYVKCDYCKYHSKLSPSDLKQKKIENFIVCFHCKEKEIKFYCLNCEKHFCSKCSDAHKTHKKFDFNKDSNLTSAQEEINIADNYLNVYYKEIKDISINILKKKIKEIEESYLRSKRINEEIFNFSKTLFNNFTENNYQSISNIINNTKFILNKPSSGLIKLGNIAQFFNSNLILTVTYAKEIKAIEQHVSSVYSMCLLKDGRLASCSHDTSIKIYNLETSKIDLDIPAHNFGVTSLCLLDDGRLVSASDDQTLKIWVIKDNTFKSEAILEGHTYSINKVIKLTKNRIASCSMDFNIIVWNSQPPYQNLADLNEHNKSVRSIIQLKNKEILVSGSEDETLKFWSLDNYSCEYSIFTIDCCWTDSLCEIGDDKIIIGGMQNIAIIDSRTFQEVCRTFNTANTLCFYELDEESVLYGNSLGDLYKLNVNSLQSQIIQRKAHQNSIYSIIAISQNMFATCSYDYLIKFWKKIY